MANDAMVQTLTIGISEMGVSADPGQILLTHALGSCVGVILYDPQARVGGLLHFLLPDSRLNPEKAADQPAMFGDTGIAMLLDEVFKRGATRRNLTVKLAGGAKSFGEASFFDIADRNVLMAKRLLWKNNLVPRAEETGGEESRTVRLFMADGRVTIKNKKGEHEL